MTSSVDSLRFVPRRRGARAGARAGSRRRKQEKSRVNLDTYRMLLVCFTRTIHDMSMRRVVSARLRCTCPGIFFVAAAVNRTPLHQAFDVLLELLEWLARSVDNRVCVWFVSGVFLCEFKFTSLRSVFTTC